MALEPSKFSIILDGSVNRLEWYPPDEVDNLRSIIEEAIQRAQFRIVRDSGQWILKCGRCKGLLTTGDRVVFSAGQNYRRRFFRCTYGSTAFNKHVGCKNALRDVSCDVIRAEHPHYFPPFKSAEDSNATTVSSQSDLGSDTADSDTVRASSPSLYTPAPSVFDQDSNSDVDAGIPARQDISEFIRTLETLKLQARNILAYQKVVESQQEEIDKLRKENQALKEAIGPIVALGAGLTGLIGKGA